MLDIERDRIFRAILESLQVCCDECREDPNGAVWLEATKATEAVLDLRLREDHTVRSIGYTE